MSADRPRGTSLVVPPQEIWLCFLIYIGTVVKCFYSVFRASAEKADILSFDLKPGWIPGHRRDSSDFEWGYWPRFYSTNAFWFLGHVLLSWLARGHHFTVGRRRAALLVYSLVALCDVLSIKLLTFLLAQCCAVYLVALIGRRRVLVWLVSLMILCTLNFKFTIDYLRALCDRQSQYMALMSTMAVCNMRLVSFGVDMCDMAAAATATDSSVKTVGFFEVVSYVFYFPSFTSGPFVSFGAFQDGMSSTSHALDSLIPAASKWQPLWLLSRSFLRLAVIWVAIEVALHWLYFTALQQEEYYLISADNFTVFSLCFVQASFFHAKYVIFYGFPCALMRLDGITAPPTPSCLVVQYRSSDIWRKFDVGLYDFVKQYLYVPLGGSKHGLSWQMITSSVCFAFVGFWHGTETHIYVWAIINYVTIVMEKMHSLLLKTAQWRSFADSLGPTMACRVQLALQVPTCILSLWSMFLFLGQSHVGYNLYKKILRNGGPESHFALLIIAYCILVAVISLQDGTIHIPGRPRDIAKGRKAKVKK